MLNLHIQSSISLIFTIFLSVLHSRYFLIHFMFLSSTVSNPLSFKFQQIYFFPQKFWWILFHVYLIILGSLFYDFIFYFLKQLDDRPFFPPQKFKYLLFSSFFCLLIHTHIDWYSCMSCGISLWISICLC